MNGNEIIKDIKQIQEESLILYGDQVSGKSPKFLSKDRQKIYKGFIPDEYEYYQFMNHQHFLQSEFHIIKYLPEFHGMLTLSERPKIVNENSTSNEGLLFWLQHLKSRYEEKHQQHSFIILNNFTYGFKSLNILDIKIGGRSEKPHKLTESVNKYKLKLNGMRKNNQHDQDWFRSKYILNDVTQEESILQNLAYFFYTGTKLNLKLLSMMIEKLKDFVLCFRCLKNWRFVSSSIVLVYDNDNIEKHTIKFIDFGRAKRYENEGYDMETCLGIENLIYFLLQIKEKPEKYENIELQDFDLNKVVPEKKLIKFSKNP